MRESCMLIMSLQGGKESLPRQRKNNKEKRGFSNWKQKWKEAQRCCTQEGAARIKNWKLPSTKKETIRRACLTLSPKIKRKTKIYDKRTPVESDSRNHHGK